MLKTIPEVIAQIKPSLNIINAADAAKECQRKQGIIIDVREPEEFSKQSADSAINIPRGLIEMKMLQMYPDENLAVFIHCATGARATLSAEQLHRVGYKNVWVITSSLDDICCCC